MIDNIMILLAFLTMLDVPLAQPARRRQEALKLALGH
jgi:hypothetical protein